MSAGSGQHPSTSVRGHSRFAGRGPAALTPPPRARRGFLSGRRANRRITVEKRSLAVWLAERLTRLVRGLLAVLKVLAAVAVLAGAIYVGRLGVLHVVASPRFALREIRVGPTKHLGRDQIVALARVAMGDRLLVLDTDAIAARLTRHPWIAAAQVRRELPSTLAIEVTERRAAAVAAMGGIYLIDDAGHAFKQATLDEADGLVVLTGLSRDQYVGRKEASVEAFREALTLLAAYQHPDGPDVVGSRRVPGDPPARPTRPALSEIHIDPRSGFSLFLYDGGAEIRLGRDGIAAKLARLDEILAALGPRGIAALRVLHLDGAATDRIPIRLAPAEDVSGTVAGTAAKQAPAGKREVKKSTAARNPSISGKTAPAVASAGAAGVAAPVAASARPNTDTDTDTERD